MWFVKEAEAAARFYTSLFPDSRIDRITMIPSDTPSGPADTIPVIEFTLMGQPMSAFSAGPLDPFNHSISFMVKCEDQAEIDRYWNALADGGTPEQCGWIKDRFGVLWQITARRLGEMMASPDRAAAKRACDAMLHMVKIDLAVLEKVFAGR
jgi:predicted 3-demethylubiquinone-9 3-methyltransferase (glyoxalase superfamily)